MTSERSALGLMAFIAASLLLACAQDHSGIDIVDDRDTGSAGTGLADGGGGQAGGGSNGRLDAAVDAPVEPPDAPPVADLRPMADVAPLPVDTGPSCGLPGLPCCPGSQCANAGGCCHQGRCLQQGSDCFFGAACVMGSCGGFCGGKDQRCCEGRSCTAGLLVCVGDGVGVCRDCGRAGEACCEQGYCGSGAVACDRTAEPLDIGLCAATCGLPGQPCCADQSCSGAACCAENTCVADGATCGTGTCQAGSCTLCGTENTTCCPGVEPGQACTTPDLVCERRTGPMQSSCVACGTRGQPCCDANQRCRQGSCQGNRCM